MTSVETSVAGLTIRSRTQGSGPAVVVFHHSFGSPGWLPFYDDLAADHTVWVPDLPGFGSSDRPDWARHPRDIALLMGRFLERVGGPVIGVGLGFGGWVAAELATMRNDAFSRLVLVGSAGLLPERGRIFDQVLVSHGDYVRAAFHDEASYLATYGEGFTDELLIAWDLNREMVARVAWKPYMYNRQLAPLLTEVATPVTLVWGEHDQIVPFECAEQYRSLLPNSRLETVAGAGHAVDMEAPAALAAIVRQK